MAPCCVRTGLTVLHEAQVLVWKMLHSELGPAPLHQREAGPWYPTVAQTPGVGLVALAMQ
jgi:hypothetical protein